MSFFAAFFGSRFKVQGLKFKVQIFADLKPKY